MLQCLSIILIISQFVSVIASSQSPESMMLDKRADVFCSGFYGKPILSECKLARNEILRWEPFHRPTSNDAFTFLAGAFEFFTTNSRHNPAWGRIPRAYLPTVFTSGGCQVAIHMREGISELDNPMNIYQAGDKLATGCVEATSQGGYTTIGVNHNMDLYMYATDSDYFRLRERRESCAQASTSGQSYVDCSNLQDLTGQLGSTESKPAASEQGPSSSTCSKGYTTQPGNCCQGSVATWSLLVAAKASLILGIQGSVTGELINWCQDNALTS